ncbi:hypothetical protein Dsin_009007 [Dipteronia sinensis]|uniref:RING-type E3 ubiquitin transferase n=1 Tax=Dipteronia sinensis TaxID=43782 RepID=A0AAE0AR03_9ROSI|nr:hypothetical protein Dsin_009007 [Dipteronia sinensis]
MEGEGNSSKRTREDDNTSGQQLWIGESSSLASSQPSRDPERQAAAVTAEDDVSSSSSGSTNHPTNYSNDRLVVVSDQLASNEEYRAGYRFQTDHPAMYHFNSGAGVIPAILRRNNRRRTSHENTLRQRQQQQEEDDNVNMMQPSPPQPQWRNSDFTSPSNQMPPSRPANNMPMAAPQRQAADYSVEHQRMRDRFRDQIHATMGHLGRQSDSVENNNIPRNDRRQAAANDDEPRPPLIVRSITAAEWRDIVTRRSQAADQLPQEEYAAGEDIGNLDCGHVYHVVCITQWLLMKNSCPICKAPALAALERLH